MKCRVLREDEREKRSVSSPRSKTKKIALAELGQRLPIGLMTPGGGLDKSFSSIPLKGREEREIGRLLKPKLPEGRYVSIVLGTLLQNVGPVDLAGISSIDERGAELGRLTAADVFYMWIWTRRQALGPDLRVKIECQNRACGKEIEFVGDLDTLEVLTVESVEDLLWSYDLKVPAQVRGVECRRLHLTVPYWHSVAAMADMSVTEIKLATIRSSVVGMNDQISGLMLTEKDLDALAKADIEGLSGDLDRTSAGPLMAVEGVCPHCGHEYVAPIDWRYESFFGSSSL